MIVVIALLVVAVVLALALRSPIVDNRTVYGSPPPAWVPLPPQEKERAAPRAHVTEFHYDEMCRAYRFKFRCGCPHVPKSSWVSEEWAATRPDVIVCSSCRWVLFRSKEPGLADGGAL